jgi:hypothetical protein
VPKSWGASFGLHLEWQDVNRMQIFRRVGADAMYLEMQCPEQDFLLRVDFSRLSGASQFA